MSEAQQIIKRLTEGGENPKKAMRKTADTRAYSARPINRQRDFAYHFYFGSPIAISFDIIARTPQEACRIANIHFWEILGHKPIEVGDERQTEFHLREGGEYKITEKQIMMWWPLEGAEGEDPIMNDEHEG